MKYRNEDRGEDKEEESAGRDLKEHTQKEDLVCIFRDTYRWCGKLQGRMRKFSLALSSPHCLHPSNFQPAT